MCGHGSQWFHIQKKYKIKWPAKQHRKSSPILVEMGWIGCAIQQATSARILISHYYSIYYYYFFKYDTIRTHARAFLALIFGQQALCFKIFRMSWLEKVSLLTLITLQQNNLVPFCFFSAAPRTCHHKHMLSSRKVTKKVYKKCGLCSRGLPSLVQLDHIKGYYFL